MEFLYSLPIRRGNLDSMWWLPSTKGIFEVRSYYYVLVQSTSSYFPRQSVWNSKVPSWVAFFIWTTAWGRILTTDNLRRRGIIILDWCCMCRSDGESVNHLLLHCSVAQELWNMILNMFGVSWVMPRDVVDLLACWAGKVGKDEAGMIWKAIPHYLMWCLWGERNARSFTGTSRSMPALKLYFLQSLFYWLKASRLVFSDSLIDMIDICTFCT